MIAAIAGMMVLGAIALLSMSQIGPLKEQIRRKDQQVATMRSDHEQLQQQVKDLQGEQQNLQGRVQDLRTQLASATTERDQMHSTLDQLQTRFRSIEEDNAKFEQRISELMGERDRLAEQQKALEIEKTSLERQAVRLKNRLAFLGRDYEQVSSLYGQLKVQAEGGTLPSPNVQRPTFAFDGPQAQIAPPTGQIAQPGMRPMQLAQAPVSNFAAGSPGPRAAEGSSDSPPQPPTIELSPIVVRSAQAEVMRMLRGQVVEINTTHGFIVVDKGSDDGVQLGMGFDVLRGGGQIAHVVVVRLRSKLSACEIVSARSPGSPQVGDLAVQSGS